MGGMAVKEKWPLPLASAINTFLVTGVKKTLLFRKHGHLPQLLSALLSLTTLNSLEVSSIR